MWEGLSMLSRLFTRRRRDSGASSGDDHIFAQLDFSNIRDIHACQATTTGVERGHHRVGNAV
ncbi:MAG: hypothetical protein AAF585_24560, partial [Verrucomicrobiota bacterium]